VLDGRTSTLKSSTSATKGKFPQKTGDLVGIKDDNRIAFFFRGSDDNVGVVDIRMARSEVSEVPKAQQQVLRKLLAHEAAGTIIQVRLPATGRFSAVFETARPANSRKAWPSTELSIHSVNVLSPALVRKRKA